MAIKPRYTKDQLKNWYTEKIKSTSQYQNLIRSMVFADSAKSASLAMLGKLYIYEYDAKHKETLPVWDRFPLTFPIERYNDGFLGLNLHYLTIDQRHVLLDRLQDFATNNKYPENVRLRLTYELLQKSRKISNLGMPCVHRYLSAHIRSQLIEIPSTEWSLAAELPVELWVRKK